MRAINEILQPVQGSYFSAIDLSQGFHQLPLTKEGRHKLVLIIHYGTFYYTRVPFGAHFALNAFSRTMQT